MSSDEIECRRAFYRYLEDLRLEVFSMYEGLRAVRITPDDEMEARMQRLGAVGASAAHVHAQVEELFAAVWAGLATGDERRAAVATARARERDAIAVA